MRWECIIIKVFFSDKSDAEAETSTTAAEGIARQWISKHVWCFCDGKKKIKTKNLEQRLLLHLFRYLLYCLRWIISENHMPMLMATIVAVLSKKERTEGLIQIIEESEYYPSKGIMLVQLFIFLGLMKLWIRLKCETKQTQQTIKNKQTNKITT